MEIGLVDIDEERKPEPIRNSKRNKRNSCRRKILQK